MTKRIPYIEFNKICFFLHNVPIFNSQTQTIRSKWSVQFVIDSRKDTWHCPSGENNIINSRTIFCLWGDWGI